VKKSIVMEGAVVSIEGNPNHAGKFTSCNCTADCTCMPTMCIVSPKAKQSEKWVEQDCSFRVRLLLPARKNKPIFYYSNDLNRLKAFTVRSRIAASSTLRDFVPVAIKKMD